MSVVIGICGTNFCSLIADGRLGVGEYPNLSIVSEKVMKVYKINDRVLLGGAGWFHGSEDITSPLDVFPDKKEITLKTAVDAVVAYIEGQKSEITTTRFYLVGGKDKNANFALYEFQFDASNQKLTVSPRIPQPPVSTFAVSCCFPPKIKDRQSEFFTKVCDCISTSKMHEEVLCKVGHVIGEISCVDESVNKNILTVTVF